MKFPLSGLRWWQGLLLLFLVLFGAILRLWEHDNLLIFKSDQARDALIMSQVLDHSLAMPLFGPQVGGTPLQIGPVSYYFQYFSGFLFGSSPEVFSYPDLLFGILFLLLVFFFLRKYFSILISLWLVAFVSVSLFLVTFSRFAWNPNSLPFFSLLFVWSYVLLLEKEGCIRWLYVCVMAFALGIVFQLHLFAALSLSIGLLVHFVFFRPLRLKEIFVLFSILFLLHTPVVLSELKTGGQNSRLLYEMGAKKGELGNRHTWIEKSFRSYQEGARFVWLFITGDQTPDVFQTKGWKIRCDSHCQKALPYSLLAFSTLGLIMYAAFSQFRVESDDSRRKSFIFFGCWIGGFIIIATIFAFELETRFYLGIVPPLLIVLGLTAEYVMSRIKSRYFLLGLAMMVVVVLFTHSYFTVDFLRGLKQSQISALETREDLRFGTAPKVTLGQLRLIAATAKRQLDNQRPVYVSGESLYAKSLYYVLTREYGFGGCYKRGENEIAPNGFNHVFISYMPDEFDTEQVNPALVPFGTLGASFSLPRGDLSTSSLPPGCLTY